LKIKIGIPARDTVMTGFAHSLAVMTAKTVALVPEIELSVSTSSGTLICNQRNDLADAAIKEGCDWLVYLDSDMRFPSDTIIRLLARNAPIVSANYVTRRTPPEPIAFKSTKTLEKLYTDEDSTGVEACAANGFGVMMIHTSVFKAMPRPWFLIPYIPEKDGFWGEDVWFCNQARKVGYDVLIDHDLSKQVKHIGIREYDYLDALAVKDEVVSKWQEGQCLSTPTPT